MTSNERGRKRRHEGSKSVIAAWLRAIDGRSWTGTASDLACELIAVCDELAASLWIVPDANAIVRWLESLADIVTGAGWTWTTRRLAAGRVIEFRKGAADAQ